MKKPIVAVRKPKAASKPKKVAPNRQRLGAPVTPRENIAASLPIAETLRDRLNIELSKIPAPSRPTYLASVTQRATPTCRRWLDPNHPGMPDLQSFAALCIVFDADANYLLGFTSIRFPYIRNQGVIESALDATSEPTRWVDHVRSALGDAAGACNMVAMKGDEMAPRIGDGDAVFVDESINKVQGNGTYYLEYEGRRFIRNVEDRLSDGLVLSCENTKYREIVVAAASAAKLTVLGRVRSSIHVQKY